MTHRQFVRKFPEFASLPEYIVGVGDRRVRLLDAKLDDIRHYQAFLERRIARRERLQRARKAGLA